MKLEDQVTSLELSKRLKELGMKQESLFKWRLAGNTGWQVERHFSPVMVEKRQCSAFTVAELGELLPAFIDNEGYELELETLKLNDYWEIHYSWTEDVDNGGFHDLAGSGDKTEANARAKMLIYLLENKLITL